MYCVSTNQSWYMNVFSIYLSSQFLQPLLLLSSSQHPRISRSLHGHDSSLTAPHEVLASVDESLLQWHHIMVQTEISVAGLAAGVLSPYDRLQTNQRSVKYCVNQSEISILVSVNQSKAIKVLYQPIKIEYSPECLVMTCSWRWCFCCSLQSTHSSLSTLWCLF